MSIWLFLERSVLALWVGGMWVSGYIVAPVLFRMLDDRMLAGQIAGQVFSWMSRLGLVCGAILLGLFYMRTQGDILRSWRLWVLLSMLAIVLVGQYGLAPAMRELKQASGGALVEGMVEYRRFAQLHGISSVLFLINSLSGLLLVAYGVVVRQS